MRRTFRAIATALVVMLALLVVPTRAMAYTCYPYKEEIYLTFQSVSENSYANYERNSGYAASGNEEDLGGIKYDESTGTLIISGHGATNYRQYISYNDTYRYYDLTDTLRGICIKNVTPDREPTLNIRFEIDTKMTVTYGSSAEPVSAIISNPSGRLFLSSTTGAKLDISHSDNSWSYSASPITGIYASDYIVVGGNLNLEVSANGNSEKWLSTSGIVRLPELQTA